MSHVIYITWGIFPILAVIYVICDLFHMKQGNKATAKSVT